MHIVLAVVVHPNLLPRDVAVLSLLQLVSLPLMPSLAVAENAEGVLGLIASLRQCTLPRTCEVPAVVGMYRNPMCHSRKATREWEVEPQAKATRR